MYTRTEYIDALTYFYPNENAATLYEEAAEQGNLFKYNYLVWNYQHNIGKGYTPRKK